MGWPGVRLPDQYCINVRLPPGCVSTAAGAYQFNLPTWKDLERRFGVRDFSPQSQDARTIELLQDIGALPLIVSGRITEALQSASARWASLPMSASGQPKVTLQTALAYFTQAGGVIA
jgi:lysozyme